MTHDLLQRRIATLGPHSPLFYNEPIELVSAEGVWMTDVAGKRYLDAYNNVPHVGHCHPRVIEALRAQASTLNIHTRYLNDRVVDYAEALLENFEPSLDRVFFTNSGSESNELAFRVATQHTGNTGVLVSDFSYHGNTAYLAGLTTGLTAHEGLGGHVRTIHIPDTLSSALSDEELLATSLAEVDAAIGALVAAGYGVAAVLVDSLFSTEGLCHTPDGYLAGVAERVRAAGGLVIADEVQSGFGRTGSHFWGYQRLGIVPDLVTLGKPMGNGHPLGGVVTTEALLDEFGRRNMYFNTFAGTPVSAAVGLAVLDVMRDEDLMNRSAQLGALINQRLTEITSHYDRIGPVRGAGLFFGFELFSDAGQCQPDAALTRAVVEDMRERGVLMSKIGPNDSVLKIRPPLAFQGEHAELLLREMEGSLAGLLG